MDHTNNYRYVNTIQTPTSDSQNISLIVIGAGLIGPRHASHILDRPDCDLFAIVDHSAKGPSVAKSLNTRLFKSLQELFDYCDANLINYPTGAIVATPNHTHLDIGIQLAAKQIHMLMEKPLAPSASDCRTLIQYCKQKNVKLLVGHHRRFNPYIISTKDNLANLGQLVAIQGTWTSCKPPSYFLEKPWRSSIEKGGGTLLINLIHDLDLLQYLLGPIEKVYAELLTKQRTDMPGANPQALVDEGAALTLRFANGCCGTFICSDNVTSPFSFEAGTGENPTIPFNDSVAGFYRIFGSHGTLSVPDMKLYYQDSPSLYNSNNSMQNNYNDDRSWIKPVMCKKIKLNHELVHSDESKQMLTPTPSPNIKEISPIHRMGQYVTTRKPQPFELQLDHFVNLIKGTETEIKCSGEDALRALLCIEAVMKSIESGLPQYVEKVQIDDYEMVGAYN